MFLLLFRNKYFCQFHKINLKNMLRLNELQPYSLLLHLQQSIVLSSFRAALAISHEARISTRLSGRQREAVFTDFDRQGDRLEVGRTDKVNTCQSQAVRTSEIGDDSREKCTSMLDVECSAAWSCQYVRPRQLGQLHGSFAGTYVNRQQLQPQQQQHVRHF